MYLIGFYVTCNDKAKQSLLLTDVHGVIKYLKAGKMLKL